MLREVDDRECAGGIPDPNVIALRRLSGLVSLDLDVLMPVIEGAEERRDTELIGTEANASAAVCKFVCL